MVRLFEIQAPGPTGPTGAAGPTGATGPNISQEGFSAFISSRSVSSNTQINNWNVSAPYFSGGNFNASTGVYTVPATGRYSIEATISYAISSPISLSIGSDVNPTFVVNRSAPTATDLITGLVSILNVAVTLLTLRTILGNNTITLAGEVQLNAGDTIALQYNADGLGVTLVLQNLVWSVYRLT